MYWWDQNVNDAVPSYHVRYSCSRGGNICDTLGCGRFDRNLYTPPIFDVTEWGRRMGTYDPRDTLAWLCQKHRSCRPDHTFGMSSPRDETHCSAMWWDSMTTRQPTAYYHRSQQQELATALVPATARTPAPFMDPADRRWVLQHSCWMV